MAKRKKSVGAVKKPDTKTLNHVKAPKSRGSKNKNKLEVGKAAGAISAVQTSKKSKEEKVQSSTRQRRSTGKTSARQTSKYFQDQPVVKNEPASEEDGIINPVLGTEAAVLKVEKREKEESEDDDDDDVEWEDVEDLGETSCALPSQPVEIEIEAPDQALKRKKRDKRKAEFENYLRRMMKRFNKELVVDIHKVHLLCLVASGIFRNKLCTEPDLLAVALSVLPAHLTRVPPEEVDTGFLCSLLKWFGATFTLNPDLPQEQGDSLQAVVERRFGTYSARNHQEMTYLFLIVLRSLQLFCRLVLSLQPLPLKQPPVKGKGKTACDTPQKSPTEPKVSPGAKRPAEPRAGGAGRGGKRQRNKEPELETSAPQQPKNSQRRRVASKVCYREESSDGEGNSEGEEFHVTSDEDSEDMDGCAIRQLAKKQSGKGRVSRNRGGRKQGDCEREVKGWRRQGEGVDEWLEVYLEKAGRWVCLDVHQESVGQPLLCSKQATQPLCYVLAVDGDGCLKDLGCRYDPTWLTSTRKRRVEEEWWEETLRAFRNPNSERELQEDQELQAKLLDKPLPTAISEYKNHPLYALKRHLLKYEALYPPTATVLGYCRGEAVYSRDCIHTLHSRDTWLKEARTVRLGEEPYKMVKGFSNRSRKARLASENRDIDDLPLFGQWQTEEYQPPVAVDGKVPRNDYGNVYLFRPCMLPIGCVHLRLPNLHRVARKLDIDCASAVTGFDFHCGFSHPVNDGYIVCEEHQEVLRAAWENEQELLEQKEKEKREKRVMANWTLLVKGLLIRERLRRRYGTKELEPTVGEEGLSSGEEDDKGACTAAVTLASSWPQNRQEDQVGDTTKREKRGRQKNLFPFEKV